MHGGGPDITAYMKRLDMPVEFVGGLRVSDEATVEIVKMVLVGKLNTDIVLRIGRHGQPAVGLSGDDGRLLRCSRRSAPGGEDIGFVGQIDHVDAGVINHIARDYIPVVASVGADDEGNSYNINADEAAAAIAVAMGARTAIFLTDVRGWLRDPADPESLIAQATVAEVSDALAGIEGGMRPKLQACVDAVRGGVGAAQIIDGRLAALAAARALHRCRHRHEGDRVSAVQSADAHLTPELRALPGRVRARRGRAAVGPRRRRVPRLPRRHLGLERRPLPPRRRRRDPRAGGAAAARRQPLLHRADVGARAPARRVLAGRQGVLRQLRHRGRRGGAEVRAQGAAGGTIVSLHGAFHGRTYGALSATPQESKQAPFAPLVGGFVSVDPTVEAIAAAVDEHTAALILEPIQGETGVHVLSDELLRFARARCDEVGATLIFDEIQTGLGRTGTAWAYQHADVTPDLLVTAKALGGGLPIGALITGARHADTFAPGDHGSTFAGGPVVCAAALAALDVLLDEALLARVRELGELLRERLATLPHVVEVRGRGLMIGFDLDLDAPEIVRRALLEQRLVINATGPVTVRLLPPLRDRRGRDRGLRGAARGGARLRCAARSMTATSSTTTARGSTSTSSFATCRLSPTGRVGARARWSRAQSPARRA